MAYIYRDDAPDWLRTHYESQIRMFWIGLLYCIIAGILIWVLIGFLLYLVIAIWWTQSDGSEFGSCDGYEHEFRNVPLLSPLTPATSVSTRVMLHVAWVSLPAVFGGKAPAAGATEHQLFVVVTPSVPTRIAPVQRSDRVSVHE